MTNIHFLDPKPKGIDKFDSLSQNRLVKSIANYIIQNDDTKNTNRIVMPRIIGIEGEWGSGKSNVNEMLRHSPLISDYNFYVYNAWGNQEDLQRRSILEGLTNRLVNDKEKNLLPKKTKITLKNGETKIVSWKERLKYLLASKKEIETNTIPQLNGWIALIILAIIFAPIFVNLAKGLESHTAWHYIVLLIPIFMVLIGYIIVLISEFNKGSQWKSFSTALNRMLLVYKGKEVHENKYETISSEEPTVEEFRNWMKDISDGLTGQQKIIIVFDDMDRLPADKVKRLWSTIHTFFAGQGFERIWVVIPFDRKHLANAFEDSEQNHVIDYFIQKTFPVVYRVAPPLKKDFDTVFMSYIQDAFGKSEKEEDLRFVDRIYKLSEPKPNVRAIMSFINEMVSLRQQWSVKDIPLVHIAVYLIGKNDFEKDPIDAILNAAYLNKFGGLVKKDIKFQNSVSALYYGVDVSDALQIPLEEFINGCIDGIGEINTYAGNKNFLFVLNNVIDSIDATKIDSTIKIIDQLDSDVPRSIWLKLATRKKEAGIKKQEFDESYKTLILRANVNDRQEILNDWYSLIYNAEHFDGGDYYNAISIAKDYIEGLNFKCKIAIKDKSVGPEQFINFLKVGKFNYKDYKISCNPDALDTTLSNLKELKLDTAKSLCYIREDGDYKFNKLHEAIKDAYGSTDGVNYQNAGILFAAYRNTSPTNQLLPCKLDHTKVNNLYTSIQNNNVFDDDHGRSDLEAMKIGLGDNVSTEGADPENIADITDYYQNYGELLSLAAANNFPLLRKVVEIKIKKQNGQRMSLEKSLSIYEKIKNAIDVSDKEILADWNQWFSEDEKEKLDKLEVDKLVPSTATFTAIKVDESSLAKYLSERICESLAEVGVDELYSNKNTETYYWNKAIEIFLGSKYMPEPSQNIINLAGKLLLDISSGSIDPTNLMTYKKVIFDNVRSSHIASSIREARDTFCNNQASISVAKFKFLEKWLRESGDLSERKGDVCDKIISPIITDGTCRNLIVGNSNFYKSIILGNNSSMLKTQMENILNTVTDEAFVNFAKSCGYELKKKDKDKN